MQSVSDLTASRYSGISDTIKAGRGFVKNSLLTLLLFPLLASAAIIDVNTLADNEFAGNGQCTLREAINNANANVDTTAGDCISGGSGLDVILFSTGSGVIEVTATLRVTGSLAIIGPGGDGMAVQGDAPFFPPIFRVWGTDVNFSLDNMSVSASSQQCLLVSSGATVRITGSSLFCVEGVKLINDVTLVLENSSIGGTRGIEIFSRFETPVTAIIENSVIGGTNWGIGVDADLDGNVLIEINNSTLGSTWGVYAVALGESTIRTRVFDSLVRSSSAGLIFHSRGESTDVSALIKRTLLKNNASTGISTAGLSSPVFVTLSESTIEGGGTAVRHWNRSGFVFLSNSTLSNNSVAIHNRSEIAQAGGIGIGQTTITNNETGILGDEFSWTQMDRNILAANTVDCEGVPPVSTGYNVIGVNCAIIGTNGDLIGSEEAPLDPSLQPLADNGGPTQTHRLNVDSPAIDRTDLARCFIGKDQRGIPRPLGNGCDAGAFELDFLAPELIVPTSIEKEATGPSGAFASFAVSATDDLDPNPVVSCNPDSGSLFAVGTTTVVCTATDEHDNVGVAEFDVDVVDTTPPVLTLLGDSAVEIIEGNLYEDAGATAFDIVDQDLTAAIVVSNPVDSTAPGNYLVAYDVSDSAGNAAATISRAVTVISHEEAVQDLATTVETMDTEKSVKASLVRPLQNSLRILEDSNTPNDAAARAQIDRFIRVVQVFLRNGRLTPDQSSQLIAEAEELQSAL